MPEAGTPREAAAFRGEAASFQRGAVASRVGSPCRAAARSAAARWRLSLCR